VTKQWLRKCVLKIEGAGEDIDMSELRIRFQVETAISAFSNIAYISITNLSDRTAQKIHEEGKLVTLEAGYEDGSGVIFKGNIYQKRGNSRETPTDKVFQLSCKSGDRGLVYGVVNKTLSAGHTWRDQVDVALDVLKPFGITAGHIADLGSQTFPRARSLFGQARDLLHTITQSTGTTFHIADQKLNIVKSNETLPGEAIVLNSNTGMIGMPVQTIGGIQVRMLLNPRVKPGSRLQIDQKSIVQAQLDPSGHPQAELNNQAYPMLASDGFYKVVTCDFVGDTRGQPWYTDCSCIALNEKGRVLNRYTAAGITNPD
jgi:hypothetical protein